MESLPVTVGAAIGLSIVTETTSYALPNDRSLISVLILLVIAGGLLLQRRRFGRSEVGGGSSWAASEEQRPVPKELASVGSIRVARVALIAVGVIALVVYPFIASTRAVNIGGVIALYAIIAVSLVVLTGWAGQVSLGQFGFGAVGAVVAGGLSGRAGFPFWIAVPVGAAAAGAVAVVIGIPALRIKGLFLAVATLAFAFAVQATLFSKRYFGWLLPKEVQRPRLFLLDFSDERSMYFLCVAALLLVVVLVGNLRRSRVGRLLIATRDNEANVQSFGVSTTRLKLMSFAISGAIAGLAGAIFAFQQRGISGPSFNAGESVNIFVLSILGGIGSPAGALLGSAFFNIVRYFLTGNQVVAIILQLGGPLLVFYAVPGGLISLFMRLRDSVLRIVAQRRQIVVPSLFADLDADALEARLIPLAEPLTGAGLNALPSETHFTMRSELYRRDGERTIEKLAPAKQTKEAAALGAAAESIADRELVTVDGETQ
jgi:branched-chain amino acid transport system permease protein